MQKPVTKAKLRRLPSEDWPSDESGDQKDAVITVDCIVRAIAYCNMYSNETMGLVLEDMDRLEKQGDEHETRVIQAFRELIKARMEDE